MKQTLTFIAAFFCLATVAQTQDCKSGFEIFKTGVTLEYTSFDKNDKVSTVMTQNVMSVETVDDTLIAKVDAKGVDAKGKDMFVSKFPIKCHKGTLYFDMRSMVPGVPTSTDQSQDMQMEISGDALLYPNDMKPGQTLPDGSIEMKMSMNGMKLYNSRYFITNRKVEGRESITTTAGTFDCIKLSYDMEYKFMGSRTSHNEIWYSEKLGMVKSIGYDKKGKVESTMLLTKFLK
ncbi:MAG: hypothetical protein IT270_19105 [Saprospiraceae bacterium]|nr:hypothetical protein [Saprospiraceae bacterium]